MSWSMHPLKKLILFDKEEAPIVNGLNEFLLDLDPEYLSKGSIVNNSCLTLALNRMSSIILEKFTCPTLSERLC